MTIQNGKSSGAIALDNIERLELKHEKDCGEIKTECKEFRKEVVYPLQDHFHKLDKRMGKLQVSGLIQILTGILILMKIFDLI